MIKLKIYFKLWWDDGGDEIVKVAGTIGALLLTIGLVIFCGRFIHNYFGEVGVSIYILLVIPLFIICACFIFGYFGRRKQISQVYSEIVKSKSEEKAKEGALSIDNDFEDNMKGQLSYADEVLKRKVQ